MLGYSYLYFSLTTEKKKEEKAIMIAVAGVGYTHQRAATGLHPTQREKARLIESGKVYDYRRQWQ